MHENGCVTYYNKKVHLLMFQATLFYVKNKCNKHIDLYSLLKQIVSYMCI